jgi:hypothetical protein
MKDSGGRLERITALAALLVTLAACGGKVIEDTPSHGCGPVGEPAATSTSSPVASSSPGGEPSASPAPTSGPVPGVPVDAGAPPVDSGASVMLATLDGGVFNDGETGSLVAIAKGSACTIPSAIAALASPDGGFPVPTTVGRELAVCDSASGFVDCVSNDGVQCSDTASVVLLYELSCVDECGAGEYVVASDTASEIAYGEPLELVAASCRAIPVTVGAGGNGHTYCCPCGD